MLVKDDPEVKVKQDSHVDAVLERNFGIDVDEDNPPQMYLPGRIVHSDIPFVHPDRLVQEVPKQRPTIKLASRNAFKDIDASNHMVNHHMVAVLRDHLDVMLEVDDEET